ncbi:MAG TPA: biotin--[acetyl-CoA-carboxylase] ligase [Bacteroidales bacterium]|nr:biotin--[acetyl-CoA-carboxylase] ligase [Bacteroidales bacterium]
MFIKQTDSTNSLLYNLSVAQNLQEGFTIYTDFQTSGRGQQGNSWESAEGQNLLFSTLFCLRDLPIQRQFLLSELVPLAIVNVLEQYAPDITVKWPNDIYWRDNKLGGILIENFLQGGYIEKSIVGVGLNINQVKFLSNAPNPVSLKCILGKDLSREKLLHEILDEFKNLRPLLHQPEVLKRRYMECLYRREGYFPYVEVPCSSEPMRIAQHDVNGSFLAKITDVSETGCLVLQDKQGKQRTYHFKEVRYIIDPR